MTDLVRIRSMLTKRSVMHNSTQFAALKTIMLFYIS
jgi:hypothetical protein